MIQVRLAETSIRLLINVNPNIPAHLKGDKTRIRQMLTNILGNAAKYTQLGHIRFILDGESCPDGRYRLNIRVSDTGIGIKQEDLPLLFTQFTRVDTTKNRHVTGTGLGLALSRNFANLMEGDIEVESHYGKGSTFIIHIMQDVVDTLPLARVKMAGQKVVIYETDPVIAEALFTELDGLGVPWELCQNGEDLPKHLDATHVVMRRSCFPAVQRFMEGLCPDGNLILLLENAESAEPCYLHHKQLPLALFCFQIANFLNGDSSPLQVRRPGFDRSRIEPLPGVRVLIVDDNSTNLQVAKGLFAPYQMDIETASSGFEAIERVQSMHYDLIFMDHMMPELDGVEATARIRALPGAYFSEVPIIALTANAIVGAKDNFIRQGMTDFLAKPIELSKLDSLLKAYAPESLSAAKISGDTAEKPAERKTEAASSAGISHGFGAVEGCVIAGVDMDRALALYGDMGVYTTILKTYAEDMQTRIPELRRFAMMEDLTPFTISVHAIKSASRGVGAQALGDAAEDMEVLGGKQDTRAVQDSLPAFMTILEDVTEAVGHYIAASLASGESSREKTQKDCFDTVHLARLKAACADMDYSQAEELLKEIDAYTYPQKQQDLLSRMQRCCGDFDYASLDPIVESLTQD